MKARLYANGCLTAVKSTAGTTSASGPGLKCCGVPNMVLTNCHDVFPDANNRLQCGGYESGVSTAPEAVTGGTYDAGSTTAWQSCVAALFKVTIRNPLFHNRGRNFHRHS